MAALHILWALLNVAILLGWLVFFRFLAVRFGHLAMLGFVVVSVAMCQSATRKQPEKPKTGTFQTTVFLSNSSTYKPILQPVKLADFTTFTITQLVTTVPKADSVQISLSPSFATGFVPGILWVPANTRAWVNQAHHQVQYQTSGFLEWRVPGLLVYRQARQFSGSLPLQSL